MPPSPLPAERRAAPVSTPGGILILILEACSRRPAPWHAWHGFSITRPAPSQRGQVWAILKMPRELMTCGGRGQVISSRGIFSIAQTCPRCDGAGRVIEKPCHACHGAGRREQASKIKIKIPPGVDTGAALRSAGNGEGGIRGGPAGNLYVVLHVRPHEIFRRDGDDLVCEVPINFVQAALGAGIEVPTLEGKADIRIPPGTQTGTGFRLKGKGVENGQG